MPSGTAPGGRIGPVRSAGSPQGRRRRHDGRSARPRAHRAGPPRRRIAPRASSLASGAWWPSWAHYRLPAGERRNAEGRGARRHEPRRPKGPSPGGEGLLFCPTTRHGGPSTMTIAERRPRSRPVRRAADSRATRRRSHVPSDGTAEAAAVEQRPEGRCSTRRATSSGRGSGPTSCARRCSARASTSSSATRAASSCPLYDVLGDYPELRHVLVRHEQGGAHAADGYARVTGRVGVCMGTSGPGATNLVTGIGTALLDSVPMVAITGNVPGRADRQGRVPGDRHQRHHAADDQAQLPGPRRRRPAAGHRRGVPHRPDRAARARSTSTSPRTRSSRRRRRRAPDRGGGHRRPARLPPEPRRPRPPAQARRRGDRRRQAAGHPGRPRRPPRRGLGRPAGLRREDVRSRSPGRCSGSARSTRPTRWPTATWACTAGSTSTGRSRAPTCSSPSACASTTG